MSIAKEGKFVKVMLLGMGPTTCLGSCVHRPRNLPSGFQETSSCVPDRRNEIYNIIVAIIAVMNVFIIIHKAFHHNTI